LAGQIQLSGSFAASSRKEHGIFNFGPLALTEPRGTWPLALWPDQTRRASAKTALAKSENGASGSQYLCAIFLAMSHKFASPCAA
jgi:hypothetical protein